MKVMLKKGGDSDSWWTTLLNNYGKISKGRNLKNSGNGIWMHTCEADNNKDLDLHSLLGQV